jgi:hypothetical protein
MRLTTVVTALVVALALGGTAVAAKKYVITSTKQVSPKVLKKLRGKRGPQGVAGPAGAAGPTGAKGDRGANGANGATSVVTRVATVSAVAAGGNASGSVACAAGEHLVGGGVDVGGLLASSDDQVVYSRPAVYDGATYLPPTDGQTSNAWAARIVNNSGSPHDMHTYALCAAP